MAKTKKSPKAPKPTMPASEPQETPETLYAQALTHLEHSEPEEALAAAQKLIAALPPSNPQLQLPALNLLGEVNVELGNVEEARTSFLKAVELDPEGSIPETLGGGAEKFLWLAQLCEEGGAESVGWFEKGVRALKHEISVLESQDDAQKLSEEERETREVMVEEKKEKLAEALCAVAEVYMTDLSWEQDAEARCEALITEALLVTPDSPSVLQTLASIRLSQLKLSDARSALTRSIAIWRRLDPSDPAIPDFPTRVSLARLLMEAEMEEEAMDVLERLALEDDESVEAAYLGGWCLNLLAEKKRKAAMENDDMSRAGEENAEIMATMRASRAWLLSCLKLYRGLEYEDERLKEHAEELVEGLNDVLGPPPEEGKEGEEDDEIEWDGIDEDEDDEDGDEEMNGM